LGTQVVVSLNSLVLLCECGGTVYGSGGAALSDGFLSCDGEFGEELLGVSNYVSVSAVYCCEAGDYEGRLHWLVIFIIFLIYSSIPYFNLTANL
jgi:hypothetical protein